jgi:hypothetical protein
VINDHYEKLKASRDYVQAILELKEDPNSPNSVFLRDLMNLTTYVLNKFDELKEEYQRQ